jgi:hypothetical protein
MAISSALRNAKDSPSDAEPTMFVALPGTPNLFAYEFVCDVPEDTIEVAAQWELGIVDR